MKKLLTAFTIGLTLTAFAQENQLILDPVTVTASLQPKPVSQTGRNIISFKGEEFANLPIHSVDELLRYLPGVEVQMRGPMGSQSDIVLRGGTFQQVLVMLDGVRINDPNTGHFSSYMPIAPAEIDHIEVLKGASSAVYGSEAVGGVVHIITKTFSAKQQANKLQVQASAAGGEYGLVNVNTGIFYQKENTSLGAGWLSNNTSGQLQRGTRGAVHNNTGSLSMNHFFNKRWQLGLRAAYDDRDFSAQNFYTTFLSDTAQEAVKTIWTQARLSYNGLKHHLSIDAGYKEVMDDYVFNKVSIANSNKSRMAQLTATDDWKLAAQTSLVSGVQFINKSIRSNDRGDHDVPQAAVFILLNHSVTKNFLVNPALRLDWNERSGAELIPQVSLSYKLKKWQLRGSAGKTIRDADFTERFNNYNKPVVPSGRIGNPDLEAERSFSYEAGADYFATSSLKISGTIFQRLYKKLIDYTTTAYVDMPRKDNLVPGGIYALARNIAKVNTNGAELDVQWHQKIGANSLLYGGLGVVWLDSKSSDSLPSFYISSHARFMTNFFIEYTYKRILISLNGVYKNRAQQSEAAINAFLDKEYFLLNSRLAVFTPNKRWSIFAQADNLLDRQYSDLLGAVMPGRWFSGGVNFKFSR